VNAAPATRAVSTSGGEVSFVDAGAGPPVVLLHGYPLSSHLWRHLVPALALRMRIVAPDLPGCGDSPAAPGAPLDLAAQAQYVRELLDGLGIASFAIVAHGAGGGVAQLLAAFSAAGASGGARGGAGSVRARCRARSWACCSIRAGDRPR
jgi:pimeloyl-ACP methyl ester carboxylesterase